MKKFGFLLIFINAFAIQIAVADEAQEYQRSIDKIAKQISTISRNINANKAVIKTERDKLFETEKALSSLSVAIQNTEKSLKKRKKAFENLSQELETAEIKQKNSKQALIKLIQSRYKSADQHYLKRLLNQDNPYAVGRLSNYHNYFSTALQEKLHQAKFEIENAQRLKKQHQLALNELNAEQAQQKQQQDKWLASKKKREKSIERLSKKVASSSEKVTRLRKNRDRLNNLLQKISKQKEELRKLEQEQLKKQQRTDKSKRPVVRAPVAGGFIKQKGRLDFPVLGKHLRTFGSRLAESGMLSEGVFIETKNSKSVKSIFRGRVLFAEFLKGYGLLMIIDHGDNYISLYGHNESLYKKVGDVVETNEVIAKSGVTGGLKSAGLYFEIRNNATPVNPKTWCR